MFCHPLDRSNIRMNVKKWQMRWRKKNALVFIHVAFKAIYLSIRLHSIARHFRDERFSPFSRTNVQFCRRNHPARHGLRIFSRRFSWENDRETTYQHVMASMRTTEANQIKRFWKQIEMFTWRITRKRNLHKTYCDSIWLAKFIETKWTARFVYDICIAKCDLLSANGKFWHRLNIVTVHLVWGIAGIFIALMDFVRMPSVRLEQRCQSQGAAGDAEGQTSKERAFWCRSIVYFHSKPQLSFNKRSKMWHLDDRSGRHQRILFH